MIDLKLRKPTPITLHNCNIPKMFWNNYSIEHFAKVPKLSNDMKAIKGFIRRFWMKKSNGSIITIVGPSKSGKSTLGAAILRAALACPFVSGFWIHNVDFTNAFFDKSILFYPYNNLRPPIRVYDLILERGWLVVDDAYLERGSERAYKYFLTKRAQNLLPTVLVLSDTNIPEWLNNSLTGEISLEGVTYE